MRHRLLIVACLLAIGLPAHAYAPPADFLLRLLADARRELGIKDMSLQLTAEVEGHDQPIDERLYLKRPERYRLVQQNDTSMIYVEREGVAAAGPEDDLKPLSGAPPELLAPLTFPRGKDLDEMAHRLLKVLQSAGIDTSMVSFGRLEESTVFIIGARSWETDKPQLWLDKTTYLPVRYVLQVKQGGKTLRLETRLLEYGSGPAGNAFPRIIEVYRDGKLVRRAEVTAAQMTPARSANDLPETLFEVGAKH